MLQTAQKHVHPDDSSIILTSNKTEFSKAAKSAQFYGAILDNAETRSWQGKYTPLLNDIWRQKGSASSNQMIYPVGLAERKSGNRFDITFSDMNYLPLLELFEKMAKIYALLDRSKKFGISASSNFEYPSHTHNFNVLNANFGRPCGSGWTNMYGQRLYAPEGGIMYIEAGLDHFPASLHPEDFEPDFMKEPAHVIALTAEKS